MAALRGTPCSLLDVRAYAGVSALIGYVEDSRHAFVDFNREHARLHGENQLMGHAVRHGRQVAFGTRMNSLRLFLSMDVMTLFENWKATHPIYAGLVPDIRGPHSGAGYWVRLQQMERCTELQWSMASKARTGSRLPWPFWDACSNPCRRCRNMACRRPLGNRHPNSESGCLHRFRDEYGNLAGCAVLVLLVGRECLYHHIP